MCTETWKTMTVVMFYISLNSTAHVMLCDTLRWKVKKIPETCNPTETMENILVKRNVIWAKMSIFSEIYVDYVRV